MVALTFTDADAAVTDLNDGVKFKLREVRGAGIPALQHDTVKPPGRDGATYVRTILDQRFLIVELWLRGTSFGDLQAQRRTLVAALNPKVGIGTLKYTPDATLYAIDCLVESGVGFTRYRGPLLERVIISFRCPDPAWYNATPLTPTVVVPDDGLTIAMSIPMSIGDNTGTATITNNGDLDAFPTITAPGPFKDPKITNTTTDKKIHFDGLVVLTGETLTINTKERTMVVDTTNVLPKLTADSEQLLLEPGANAMEVVCEDGGPTFTFTYNERYLGV